MDDSRKIKAIFFFRWFKAFEHYEGWEMTQSKCVKMHRTATKLLRKIYLAPFCRRRANALFSLRTFLLCALHIRLISSECKMSINHSIRSFRTDLYLLPSQKLVCQIRRPGNSIWNQPETTPEPLKVFV